MWKIKFGLVHGRWATLNHNSTNWIKLLRDLLASPLLIYNEQHFISIHGESEEGLENFARKWSFAFRARLLQRRAEYQFVCHKQSIGANLIITNLRTTLAEQNFSHQMELNPNLIQLKRGYWGCSRWVGWKFFDSTRLSAQPYSMYRLSLPNNRQQSWVNVKCLIKGFTGISKVSHET